MYVWNNQLSCVFFKFWIMIQRKKWNQEKFYCSSIWLCWLCSQIGQIQDVLVTEISHNQEFYVGHNKCYDQVQVWGHVYYLFMLQVYSCCKMFTSFASTHFLSIIFSFNPFVPGVACISNDIYSNLFTTTSWKWNSVMVFFLYVLS